MDRSNEKFRIMFVCHGNICRSPMAEFIFLDMCDKAGIKDRVEVKSSATSLDEIWNGIGNPVYPNAALELKKMGISCAGKRATLLKRDDYGKYDLFIGMDEYNVRNMKRILGGDDEGKICKILDFTDNGGDVSDPWYTRRFDVASREIKEGCRGLLEHLLSGGSLR